MNDDLMFAVDLLKGLSVIFALIVLVVGGVVLFDVMDDGGVSSWNSTDSIVFKEISYDSRYHYNRYFIFTEDYCFDVDLSVYNRLKVGDKVNLTHYDYGSCEWRYGGHVYCPV